MNMDGKVAEVAGKHPVAANTAQPGPCLPPWAKRRLQRDLTQSHQGSSCSSHACHPAGPCPMPGDPLQGNPSPCKDSLPPPAGVAVCSVTQHQGYPVVHLWALPTQRARLREMDGWRQEKGREKEKERRWRDTHSWQEPISSCWAGCFL